MKLRFLGIFVCLIICLSGFSQTLTAKELFDLHSLIGKFLNSYDTAKYKDGRNAELIIIFIETDSSSRIKDINFLCDEKNRDAAYDALSHMRVEDLETWQPKNCKNKVIVIPFSSVRSNETNNYADRVFWKFFWKRQRPPGTFIQENDIIISKPYIYSPSTTIKEPPPERGQ